MKKNELERRRRNADILRRMQAGEPLTNFSKDLSFFPPRPIIKKDMAVVKKLYKLDDEET